MLFMRVIKMEQKVVFTTNQNLVFKLKKLKFLQDTKVFLLQEELILLLI